MKKKKTVSAKTKDVEEEHNIQLLLERKQTKSSSCRRADVRAVELQENLISHIFTLLSWPADTIVELSNHASLVI